jgi:hypothetical protein
MKTIIHSGLVMNSFNPSIIHLSLNKYFSQSNLISILDNNMILFQMMNLSTITMILSDGYHHLDFIVFDETEQIEYYQAIEISTGSQSLLITVLNKQYKPVENITVHLELFDYPHINIDYQTNQFGEVIFRNLPQHAQVYIEAICMITKRQAYAQIDTLNYQNLTFILKEMSLFYDDEYDASDRGYYAV